MVESVPGRFEVPRALSSLDEKNTTSWLAFEAANQGRTSSEV